MPLEVTDLYSRVYVPQIYHAPRRPGGQRVTIRRKHHRIDRRFMTAKCDVISCLYVPEPRRAIL